MNDMAQIIQAQPEDRRGLFQQTAQRLGCAPENIEKDFWVCWTLDALYNKAQLKPRLLFKGGTSLSKAFDLIQRFSEDIDVTVFRADLTDTFPSDRELKELSAKQRGRKLDEIKAACQAFIKGEFQDQLMKVASSELKGTQFKIEIDDDDPDGQSLLFHYPSAFDASEEPYVRRVVKIESGAKSALDPHVTKSVTPYVADDAEEFDLSVPNVVTIKPERTFWDKIIILHGQRHWFENRGELYKDGQRLSRHYYDVYRLLQSDCGKNAITDLALAEDCVAHARIFFNRKPLDLDVAKPGTFGLSPHDGMLTALRTDYEKMAGMIFGATPKFDDVIGSIGEAEKVINAGQKVKT